MVFGAADNFPFSFTEAGTGLGQPTYSHFHSDGLTFGLGQPKT